MEFDPEKYNGLAALDDVANKLLMLVLDAVIKAGASREHEYLLKSEMSFLFIRKMEPKRVMDTMLVSRVRILYIRSLLARSPELQSIKVTPVERFLEKDTGRSRSSSRISSLGRSHLRYDSSTRNALIEEHIHGLKVNIKQEKKSKFSSIILKLRGIKQVVNQGKSLRRRKVLQSITRVSLLSVHTPAGEPQRQIRA